MGQPEKNQAALTEFASKFDPPLKVVGTQNIDNRKVAHGFMAAYHDPEREIGITAICWGKGHFKAFLEITGAYDVAEDAGQFLSQAIKRYANPQSE